MLSPFAWLSSHPYQGSASAHAILELSGVLLALLGALALLSRFWVLGDRLHLLIGLTFLLNALNDGLHGGLSLHEGGAFVSETYWLGRGLAALFLLLAPWLDAHISRSDSPWRETVRSIAWLMLLIFLVFMTSLWLPLEAYIHVEHWLPRPLDFSIAVLLLGAYWTLMHQHRRSADPMLWWVALSVVMQVAAQCLIAFSPHVYDANNLLGQVYSLLAYTMPLLGFSLFQSQNLVEHLHTEQVLWQTEQELRGLNAKLEWVVTHRTNELVTEVTRRMTAQERLYDKEERLRLALEVADIGTWHWDVESDQDIRDANLNRILGEVPEESTQLHADFLRRVHPEDRDDYLQQYQTAIQQHTDYLQEHRLIYTDGTVLWVRNCGRCFYNRQGKPTHMIGALFDITQRKQAEQQLQQHQQLLEVEVLQRTNELRQMHEKFRQLFFNNKAVELIIDPSDGTIVDANLAAEKYYGYSLKLLKTLKISDINILSPDEIKVEMQRAKTEQRSHFFFRHRLASGEIRDVEAHSGPILLGSKHLLYSIIHDITERKLAEEQLRYNEARFRLLAEYATDMISRHTTSGTYTYVSPSCYSLLGYQEEELLGHAVEEFFHADDSAAMTQVFRKQARHPEQKAESISYRIRCKDGRYIWFETTMRSVSEEISGETKEIIAISRDISAHKRQELALQQAKDEAEAANRAKSAFLANMSHEFRTPLNGILGYAQVLLRDVKLSDSQREGIEVIHRSGDYLLKLVNDILDLSKIEAERLELEPNPFNLLNFVRGAVEVFITRAQQKGIKLSTSTAAEVPQWVRGDERRLRQIMLNLLGNAVKFTPKGGCVTLQVVKHEEQVLFKVTDTGIGIAEDKLARIFQPFEQIEHPQHHTEGTGLGLSITAKLIELMQGHIEVSSQLGKGSEFRVYLSLPEEQQAQVSTSSDNCSILGYVGEQRHILIVDDAFENRLFLRHLLENVGFSVSEADNGEKGIARVQQSLPDLVLMDLVMPGIDGLEATRRLHQQAAFAELPIIAISASAFEYHREQSLAAGCLAFLSKPVNTQQLFATIGQYLHLEWIYQTPVGTAAALKPVHWPAVGPNVEQAQALRELALRGNIQGIIDYVQALSKDNPTLAEFAQQAKQFAQELDEENLCEMAKHYLANSNNG